MSTAETTQVVISFVELGLAVGKEIITALLAGNDVAEMRVKDTVAWREHEKKMIKPKFGKLIEEYRKRVNGQ